MTAIAIETDLRASLDELARACRILEMEGHGDMTLGHLSCRDPQQRGFWLKRNRIGLGEVLGADVVILATNFHAVMRWVPAEIARNDSRFAGLEKIQTTPILGAHLWFDRPVMNENHLAFLKGPLQWLFKKDAEGKAVHGVISAARAWVDIPREEALKQFEQQVRQTLAAARDAKLLRGVIVIEKRATFAPLPGVDRLRPPQAPPPGGIENLFLAGDYTLSGWPATMEGAVRSGYLAADGVMALGTATGTFLVSDLPRQWPARLIGFGK